MSTPKGVSGGGTGRLDHVAMLADFHRQQEFLSRDEKVSPFSSSLSSLFLLPLSPLFLFFALLTAAAGGLQLLDRVAESLLPHPQAELHVFAFASSPLLSSPFPDSAAASRKEKKDEEDERN